MASTTPTHPAAATGAAAPSRVGKSREARRAPAALVVVGNGMASYKFCDKLASAVRAGKFRVIVFGEEPRPAYDRVHLTQYFEGRSPEQLQLATREWYAEQGIGLHVGDPVIEIDRERRLVRSRAGREVAYDQLILATGSRAFVPPIEGADLPGVFVYRTIEDLERIKAHAANCRRAAVLGGGLLGLEAGKALRDLGLKTWIVERGSSLLARQLEPKTGALLQAQVARLGLNICTQREVERIESLGADRLLQFQTGECLRVQMVVIAVGIRPRDELAAQCGLQLGRRGGVAVNDALQTSDPNIYAIGECACHNGICYGLAAPGYQMADLLADNLLGKRRKFTGSDQSTRLKLPGIEVAVMGEFQAEGETLRWEGPAGCRQLVVKNGRVIGATAVGEWAETGRVHELVERRARLWRWQRRRFHHEGRLWKGDAALHVTQWSAAAVVCNCTGVRRGALTEACAEGCRTVEQLARRTGASTVCGSCKPLLAELVGAPPVSASVPGLKALAVASGVALALALLILVASPISFATSVQTLRHKLDILWRDSIWKQVTGFTLIGLALISLVMSLRKRIKRFKWGEFGYWRAAHAILGALTLVFLVSHTGFRLGQNFNRILMLNFLALALIGALAGAVTALERRLSGPVARRLRSFWTGAHIAMAWPLPVFIVVHVLMAYYF